MSISISRRWSLILGMAILLTVLIAGCTSSPYGPTQTTTQATTAPIPPTPPVAALATTASTTVPAPQITATMLNQTTVAITIKGFAFSPQFVTVSKGTTVTWTNQDSAQHQIINDQTVTAAIGLLFKSSLLGMGQSYSYTFNTTGVFAYHCNIHPAMTGRVTVM